MSEHTEQDHLSPGVGFIAGHGGQSDDLMDSVISRIAEDPKSASNADVDQLTEFFLGEGRKRPGEGSFKTMGVNLTPDEESMDRDEWVVKVRSISWEEWDTSQRLGLVKDKDGIEQADGFRQASYVCAYAIVSPDLGELRGRLPVPEGGQRPDVSTILRDFFRYQPGQLVQLQNVVLRMSRLSLASNSVREVDAAKT